MAAAEVAGLSCQTSLTRKGLTRLRKHEEVDEVKHLLKEMEMSESDILLESIRAVLVLKKLTPA